MKSQEDNPNAAATPSAPRSDKSSDAALKSKIFRASQMRFLPKEDTKIIIIPRGGRDIRKIGAATVADAILAAAGISQDELSQDTLCPSSQQNTMVASTPKRENANQYIRIKQIRFSGKVHELCAYETAPHSTCKGVIRDMPLRDYQATIDGKIINQNNPFALAAKRTLRQGPLSSPLTGTGCRILSDSGIAPGLPIPDQQPQYTPKCKICGGPHVTAGKECAHRFKPPYIIRRRRFERARQQEQLPTPLALERPIHKPTGLQKSLCLDILTHVAFSSALQLMRLLQVPHRERLVQVRGNERQAANSKDLHDPRLTNELEELRRANDSLRKENAQFKQEISRLAAEMAEIRSMERAPPAPQPAACASAMDTRRALDDSRGDETVEILSQVKNVISNIDRSLSSTRNSRAPPPGHATPTAQVSNFHSVIAPPMEGAILEAALSQSVPKDNG
ncbi:hypothetical protein HPB49_011983 [Dermacentor silvarum]|uniref:Uncharacterized protein n=1 Tax=Dermacentor silvarum TaxID=543639 RepID=A0ACB8CEV5_DERSI|nr:hypothetical protein HPB49_011983 [Dermacentor silvarum]